MLQISDRFIFFTNKRSAHFYKCEIIFHIWQNYSSQRHTKVQLLLNFNLKSKFMYFRHRNVLNYLHFLDILKYIYKNECSKD